MALGTPEAAIFVLRRYILLQSDGDNPSNFEGYDLSDNTSLLEQLDDATPQYLAFDIEERLRK